MAEWVQPVIDIMMSGSADVAHYQLDQIYGTVDQPKQYLRIDESLKGKLKELKLKFSHNPYLKGF